jgi:diguanylate cyclase (GGDEF)-like protein
VAYYNNLPPGTYRFRVIASNNDGVWNETGAVVEIYLQPYFYQTRWFYALCALVIVVSATIIYGFRVRQLMLRERKLTKLVKERTTELAVANEKLQQLASSDGLTNIANHRSFKDFLSQEWRRAMRQQTPISLLLMDIDYFKAYNDTYGHQSGDDCLKKIASALSKTANRPTDLVARYGGEEFAIVLSHTDIDGALTVAKAIRFKVEELKIPHAGSTANEYVTLSIGIATETPKMNSSPEEVVAAADKALYRAKESGRNQYCVSPSETKIEMDEIEKAKSFRR